MSQRHDAPVLPDPLAALIATLTAKVARLESELAQAELARAEEAGEAAAMLKVVQHARVVVGQRDTDWLRAHSEPAPVTEEEVARVIFDAWEAAVVVEEGPQGGPATPYEQTSRKDQRIARAAARAVLARLGRG